ncbi:MAG: GHKL domain-containing protein [Lachnospiraceae bacterium]|nr:GHKL domain-containing protein [Lachnospiraceae bacterium]
MDDLLLAICTCLSCFIVATILFQFMNDRYNKIFHNKYVYYYVEIITIVGISIINLFNFWILNLIVWFVAIIIISCVFYFDDSDNMLRRITECEVLLFCMGVCESLGVVFVDWMLKLLQIDLKTSTMRSCMEITFSKVVVIFMYYMIFARLMNKKKVAFTKAQWAINFIILIYSLINMLVIAEGALQGQANFILTVNMGCIVLADLYLLYFIKVANEKNYLEGEIEILEKQAHMQYEYYLMQEQKYNATVHILHDVDKHVKSIEKLYAIGENGQATEYVKEIKNMLEPLIPIKYTGNPILDILLTDKATISKEKKIKFDIKVDNINMDFLEAIDTTTIFGNLIDNAIEAVEKVEEDRCIQISILPYQEMVFVRIENASLPLKWRNGFPVSEKGKNHGLGLLNVKRSIEKYDGDISFQQKNGVVTVDLLLNS